MKYLTTLEAANDLKVSKQTLLNWLYAGKIPEPPRNVKGYRLWSESRVGLVKKIIAQGRLHSRTIVHRTSSNQPEFVDAYAREVSDFLRDGGIEMSDFLRALRRAGTRPRPPHRVSPPPARLTCRLAALGAAFALAATLGGAAPSPSILLRGGRLVDGTGAASRLADVRVRDGRIVEIGSDLWAAAGDSVLDVAGLVVAPGFIDVHSHVDRQIFTLPATSQTAQGITTAVVGVDGAGPYPVGAFLDRLAATPPAINVAAFVGHTAVRRAVMGDARRRATPREVQAMARRVSRALDEGAFGLSSGLEYEPAFAATMNEVAALAREAAHTVYASHVRSEGDSAMDALAEAVDVGRRTGIRVHVSHLKLASPATRGRATEALAALAAADADVTADWYPYSFWVTTTAVLLPRRGGPDAWADVIADAGGADRLTVTTFAADRSYEGRTIADLAREQGRSAPDILGAIARRGHAGLAGRAMDEGDLETFLRSPRVMIASDGGIRVAHPRGAGTFPRVLGRYVRERGIVTLESAVHKMTGVPAGRLRLRDRGVVAPGAWADLVVFDAATVADRATALLPHLPPAGIVHVLVNGVPVIADGRPTPARPGRPLRRE